jgi:hypothetical protein
MMSELNLALVLCHDLLTGLLLNCEHPAVRRLIVLRKSNFEFNVAKMKLESNPISLTNGLIENYPN